MRRSRAQNISMSLSKRCIALLEESGRKSVKKFNALHISHSCGPWGWLRTRRVQLVPVGIKILNCPYHSANFLHAVFAQQVPNRYNGRTRIIISLRQRMQLRSALTPDASLGVQMKVRMTQLESGTREQVKIESRRKHLGQELWAFYEASSTRWAVHALSYSKVLFDSIFSISCDARLFSY